MFFRNALITVHAVQKMKRAKSMINLMIRFIRPVSYKFSHIAILISMCSTFILASHTNAVAQKKKKKKEPTVQQVQQVAIQYARLHPNVFRSMISRSKVQALLPQLTLRMTTDLDQESRSLTRFGETNEPQDISATEIQGDDLQLYAEARWKLNETIFNYQETAIMRENRYSAKERQKLLQVTTQLFFERKRALIRLKSFKKKSDERNLHILKIQQIEAELDALTGSWFTQNVSPLK